MSFRRCPANKVLLCIEGGSAGRKIGLTDKEVCFGNKLACFNTITINDKYLYYFLQSQMFLDIFRENLSGIISGVSLSNIKDLILPLPPIEEQQRIVDKIECFNDSLQHYEILENKLSLLESSFEEKFKASILQYAIEGKLVKQDPNDEPARALLDKIKAEKEKLIKEGKIKRGKNESAIYLGGDKNYYDNQGKLLDVPLDIPSTWLWVRLDDIYQHNTGKALNEKNREGELLEYITTSNLYWNYFVLNDLKKMYFKPSEIEKCTIKEGDLLVCEGGDVGRAAIWKEKYLMRIQNHIHRLRHYYPISNMFYYYVFRLYKYIKCIGGKGIVIQGLSSNALGNILLPFPTLSIQVKTTQAIDKIYKFIDSNE